MLILWRVSEVVHISQLDLLHSVWASTLPMFVHPTQSDSCENKKRERESEKESISYHTSHMLENTGLFLAFDHPAHPVLIV